MANISFDDIEASRSRRNQKLVAEIVADRLRHLPTERSRTGKVLALQAKLRRKLGDEDSTFAALEQLRNAEAVELEQAAVEVGVQLGIQLGWSAPILPEALAPAVEDVALALADHSDVDGDLVLAWVLRSRLLARHGLAGGDEAEGGPR
jgi:hypothetical protein